MRRLIDRIVKVTLRAKLVGGFVAVICLTVIACSVSTLSQHYVKAAVSKLLYIDEEICDLSLKSIASIYKARRNEKDFLLQHRKLGLDDARARYLSLLQVHVADISRNMSTIRELTNDPDLVQQTLAVEEAVHRYESGFLSVVELAGRLGHMGNGLEGRFRSKIHEIESIVREHQLDRLLINMLELRRTEKDYVLRGIEQYTERLRELAQRFKADVVRTNLPQPLQERLLTSIEEYVALFEQYVQTSTRITSDTDAYLSAVHLVEPLLEDLRARAIDTVDKTRANLDYVALTTMRTMGFVGLGAVALGLMVAFLVSRSITNGVRACMDFAGRVSEGDLETRLLRDDNDEFTALAGSLNKMADALLDSRLSQEQRRAELAQMNETLKNEIAERKHAEEQHSRLATAVEQAAESIFMTDRKGIITYVNPAFEQVSEYAREDLIGRNFGILKSGQHDERFYRTMWNTISNGQLWIGHLVSKMKNGTCCEFETSISPIRDSAGAIISFVSVNRDVTQEVKLERQLRQAQKMEAMGTLAGGIAHDFNNILGIIIGYTDLVLFETLKGSTVEENLGQVHKAANRAKELVRQILAFSRQSEQERSLLRVGPIAKETVKLMRAALPATIEIRRQIETVSSGADIVMADPTQIHQVIMNLCTNAAHAMREEGGILNVGLSNVEFSPDEITPSADLNPGPYLRLTVSDTGHGMNQAVLERIFEPYFTTKGAGEGTGLGLAVVHGIVKSHGGAVTAYSKPGEGSIFHVYLPRMGGETTSEEMISSSLPRGSETILFVDDEPGLADAGNKILGYLGYKVVSITSSIEALDIFRTQPNEFDLLITDMTMPQMTGLDLAKRVLRIRRDIPIIMCTGFSSLATPERVKAMGIRELIMKPLLISDVAGIIRKVLDEPRPTTL